MGGGEGGRGWISERIGCIVHVQGGGGDTSMITYSVDKCPSDPVFCFFECLVSAFLNASLLFFYVIMINNEFFPLVLSRF